MSGAFGDGSAFEFERLVSGEFVSKYDKREKLENLDGAFEAYLLTSSDGDVERFQNINGKYLLVSTHTKEGLGQILSYSPEGKLSAISDASGRAATVEWTGHVVASVSWATGSTRYRYETVEFEENSPISGTERLIAVDVYDDAERLLTTKRYHYDDINSRHLLTGVTDNNAVRFATYAYDQSARAILSEHAGGANRFTFAYPAEDKRVVTDPLGTQREINLDYNDSMGRITRTSQPAGSGCGPGLSTITYDRSGRPSSITEFSGKKTCFFTDAVRGLVTSEVSGLRSTATCPASETVAIASGSRQVSTQWHPDLQLEIATARARLITRYVYNGQPDADGRLASCAENATLPGGKPIVVLCAKTDQATKDADGAEGFAAQPDGRPRTWRYSYNATGQRLNLIGPADALGQAESSINVYYSDTTASHAKGDLASTQNAVGDLTQFLEYTKDGLASKIRRPDGVTVRLSYGDQQLLASSTVENSIGGIETTQYSYDSIGQLTRIGSPDGAILTFTYDDAHRLTSMSDRAGNRIQMTLDNMGNVTRQEFRDAAGRLVRERNHAFDALNRLASVQRNAQSPATRYLYDRAGNLKEFKDSIGRTSKSQFDNLDRLVKSIHPPPGPGKAAPTVGYSYDHQDRLVSVTDPRKLTTRYTLDGHGQRKLLKSPDTNSATYEFDDAGILVSRRDGRGVTTKYGYDAARRVTKVGEKTTFEYGKDGSSATGKLVAMSDESGNTIFSYDGFGRPQEQIQRIASEQEWPFGKGPGFCSPKKKKNSCEVGESGDI